MLEMAGLQAARLSVNYSSACALAFQLVDYRT
jgi:hypothetical protein